MNDWIPFKEGSYLVERAFLFAPDKTAVSIEDAVIDVYIDRFSIARMTGRGLVRNVHVVQLLEDHDDLDLLLDLGDEFKYLLRTPEFQGGKVFSRDTKSFLRFAPTGPLEPVQEKQFEEMVGRMSLLDREGDSVDH
jgi:hypothetical protein